MALVEPIGLVRDQLRLRVDGGLLLVDRLLLAADNVEQYPHLVLMTIDNGYPRRCVTDPVLERLLEVFNSTDKVEGIFTCPIKESGDGTPE
ncbi:MAG: hypothetical protein LC798_19160 [Chloroflexi bacterium]|nr:hypothetical protein [Chloroflexota bacterium]